MTMSPSPSISIGLWPSSSPGSPASRAHSLRRRAPCSTNVKSRVLTLVALGNTSVEIGQKLRLSKRTVDFHIDNARIKLRATTRAEAAIKAVAAGLIKPEDDR